MENEIAYWFYLEPYTFIFEGENCKVVYNTINSFYMKFSSPEINQLLADLSIPENGYCIPIKNIQAKNIEIVEFVHKIRNSFSGDVVSKRDLSSEKKPFIFVPILRLNNDVNKIKKEDGRSIGDSILRNVSEVTCYLPGRCEHDCPECGEYCKQMIHCAKFDEINLGVEDYLTLFEKLESCGVNKVNLVFARMNDAFNKFLLIDIDKFNFKKCIYVNYKNINYVDFDLISKEIEVNIYIHSQSDVVKSVKNLLKYENLPIKWKYIIENESDLDNLNKLSDFQNIHFIPFYNKRNISFFEKYVYNNLDDTRWRN